MRVLGVRIDKVNMTDAVEIVDGAIQGEKPFVVVTPNSEIVVRANEDENLHKIIENADLVVPDGIGLVVASKIIGENISERVAGIDLMTNILSLSAKKGYRVFLLGSKEEIVSKAVNNIIEKYENINIVGYNNGYYRGIQSGKFGDDEEIAVIEKIKESKPDIVFVAFGSPSQEKFIDCYKEEIGAKLYMGVGGSFDVISGIVKRAPIIWQKMGLEWLYRLIKEPWRIKRAGALPVFALNVFIKKDKPMK